MIPEVRKDVLTVLNEALVSIKSKDYGGLRSLSDRTIHNCSIFQDEDSISIAVIMYSLAKLSERGADIRPYNGLFKHAIRHLLANQFNRYRSVIKKITKAISSQDSQFKIYVRNVIDSAQVKKGSKIYYHGISLAQAANLLGISQWDLMNYVGETRIIDRYPAVGNVRQRLEFARKLFIK